jgi:hypothetical protein
VQEFYFNFLIQKVSSQIILNICTVFHELHGFMLFPSFIVWFLLKSEILKSIPDRVVELKMLLNKNFQYEN